MVVKRLFQIKDIKRYHSTKRICCLTLLKHRPCSRCGAATTNRRPYYLRPFRADGDGQQGCCMLPLRRGSASFSLNDLIEVSFVVVL